ncbi:DUF3465 domain-containing protein [Desulfopila sp. IMCC35008]|uniref:DUF3465 domain-containing protein n=1 Tax=Desulfopila sp. IMCC35008 TaxID=2653858 RepID=UPI0013D408D5|nr:DUF3465 domain-containing protein [Desulfopila sp. IMCC35008]
MDSRNTRKLIYIIIFILVALRFYTTHGPTAITDNPAYDNSEITRAYSERLENIQVNGSGTVIKLLPDDLKGSRHQKIIVRISPDHTILIAHNIDLAPRLDTLKEGDTIRFSGEYEYNSRGGVVHWTHHDPKGHHADGWIIHDNTTYK